MIKAIIVDDEIKGAKTLGMLLEKYCPAVQVTGLYENVALAREAIEQNKPDLVFLDIEMPVENGFNLIEQTKDYSYEVIFTTAYNHYAIHAIKADAADYLLKPIDIDELVEAVDKVQKRLLNKQGTNLKHLEKMVGTMLEQRNRKIPLPSQEGLIFVSPDEIVSFEADSNYTDVYLVSKKKITVSKTLKTFEKTVEGLSFLRTHHSHIINLIHIERYLKGDGGTLIMKNERSVPVSRAYKNEVLARIGLEG